MKKNESGRSMVEMLGTLAVMGVLTLMGVKGYQTAIARYQANEVLNVAQMILQERMAADLMGGNISLQVGKLPGNCYICLRSTNLNQLEIGNCDPKIMDAIGSILGTERWKTNADKTVGNMATVQGESAIIPSGRAACRNQSKSFIYNSNGTSQTNN